MKHLSRAYHTSWPLSSVGFSAVMAAVTLISAEASKPILSVSGAAWYSSDNRVRALADPLD